MERGSGRQSILIVDDQPANLTSYEVLLEEFDVDLFKATSGNEALALLMKQEVALVLLDVQMPGMDGFEVAALMRKSRRTQHIPVIFVTAISKESQYVFQGYESGAVDYLTKPIEPAILRAKVRVFLELDLKSRQLRDSLDRLRQTLEEVDQLREKNDVLLKSVGESILGLDSEGRIMFANPAAEACLCLPGASLLGQPISEFLLIDADLEQPLDWRASAIYQSCQRGQGYQDMDLYAHKSGFVFPIAYTATPITKPGGEYVGAVLVFKDDTDRKAAEHQLRQLAQYDALTGLANRSLFSLALVKSLIAADNGQHSLALLFLDLDRFKQVNDTLGHDVGDQLLIEAASRLRRCTRETDTVARLGGDEFTVILESGDARQAAALVAQKILNAFSAPFQLREHEVFVGASIGIVIYPEVRQDAHGLLRCADLAMYRAKALGRSRYQFYTPDLQVSLSDSLQLESRLRRSLEANELYLEYQPQVSLADDTLLGFEALARWHPAGDEAPMSPMRFIPVAEETGFIVPLGEWVLRHACRQLKQWQDERLLSPQVRMSVNLSVRQLKENVYDLVTSALQETGLPASCLELEITESMLVENPEAMGVMLRRIADLGVRISIDDFGTGYSSLTYLKRLPIDVLKIDRSFVKDIGHDKQDEAIARTIIGMAHSLDLHVIAEGVETAEQLDFLKAHACDAFQGYLFSRPLPAAAIVELLRREAARIPW